MLYCKVATVARTISSLIGISMLGLGIFVLTALATKRDLRIAWGQGGVQGIRDVMLSAYEATSLLTLVAIFVATLLFARRTKYPYLSAIALVIFYPLYAMIRLLADTHTGGLLPFEFLGYGALLLLALFGAFLGTRIKWSA